MAEILKLLAIFPHPDDETLGLGSTMARYSEDENVETYLLCATHGERGWFDSEGPNPGFEGVARIREEELKSAAEHLGITEVFFLDYIDGDVDQADPKEIIGNLVAHIRRIQPDVVVSFGPDGTYGHPDHIALSQFTTGALVCAADDSYKDPDNRHVHRVAKYYFMVDPMEVVDIANDAFGGISMEVDGVMRNHVAWSDWQITTKLDNREYMNKVRAAIQCHKSQLAGYGPIGGWAEEKLTSIFGEGCFYRAFSLVNGGRTIETDLFAGLRG